LARAEPAAGGGIAGAVTRGVGWRVLVVVRPGKGRRGGVVVGGGRGGGVKIGRLLLIYLPSMHHRQR
jgi:hypothetical protein